MTARRNDLGGREILHRVSKCVSEVRTKRGCKKIITFGGVYTSAHLAERCSRMRRRLLAYSLIAFQTSDNIDSAVGLDYSGYTKLRAACELFRTIPDRQGKRVRISLGLRLPASAAFTLKRVILSQRFVVFGGPRCSRPYRIPVRSSAATVKPR